MEVRVRKTMQGVRSGIIITASMAMSACQKPVADSRITSKLADTVTITANCAAGNQIDVKVNKWVLYMKKRGEVVFIPVSTAGAAISVTQQSPALWPFDQTPPLSGNGKIKNTDGDYRYDVRVACSIGATGDSVRAVIDPDIIVN